MNFKYKKSELTKLSGFLFLLLSLMWIAIPLVPLSYIYPDFSLTFDFDVTSLMFLASPLIVIFSLYGSFFFFTIDKRDYLTLKDSCLYYKKRYFFPPVKINLDKAEDYRVTGNKLVLFLEKNGEEEIYLQLLKIRDAERLEAAIKRLIPIKKTTP
ncbi:hypothetical protein CEF21_01480 [Bacillus sp. FJAT-42376]|uniref:hypothetical protein n=1 Tax=Bacillus sp. FJAT-42376 TaxID=2014076 RepID=UPI000F4F3998|nr:hypothetical protein [Bacillus sp. FJAT-42376]AZB41116.1 hypothetical protein CEF21_01480 [Bacillus sp. FJAT-42376]